MDLNLRLLEALTAVAEEGSMTRAAVRLTMTQQAVSGQIRQLERIVGTPLVRRLPSGVELTVAGQAVVKQGRSLLTATTAMVDEARRIGSGGCASRSRRRAQRTSCPRSRPRCAAPRRTSRSSRSRCTRCRTRSGRWSTARPTPRSCGCRSAATPGSSFIR